MHYKVLGLGAASAMGSWLGGCFLLMRGGARRPPARVLLAQPHDCSSRLDLVRAAFALCSPQADEMELTEHSSVSLIR